MEGTRPEHRLLPDRPCSDRPSAPCPLHSIATLRAHASSSTCATGRLPRRGSSAVMHRHLSCWSGGLSEGGFSPLNNGKKPIHVNVIPVCACAMDPQLRRAHFWRLQCRSPGLIGHGLRSVSPDGQMNPTPTLISAALPGEAPDPGQHRPVLGGWRSACQPPGRAPGPAC